MNQSESTSRNSKKSLYQEAGISPKIIWKQIDRILASNEFKAKERLKEFLKFIVNETLEGRGDQLNGTQIALTVFHRDESFDPQSDSVVRVQANRLRQTLDQYYREGGREDPVLIEIPKGAYIPLFKNHAAIFDDRSPDNYGPVFKNIHGTEDFSSAPCVAVLPFTNISPDKEDEYIADGITEELIVALSRFQGFRVIAGQSIMRFKSQTSNIMEINRVLGARYILVGSVRKHLNNLRISAQLTDAPNGLCLWAETYDADLNVSQMFAVQEEITRRVTAMIADNYGVIPRLLAKESKRKPPEKLGAYDAVLRFYHYNWQPNREAFHNARQALEEAVSIDPDYALAWALLAEIYCDDLGLNLTETGDKLDKAYEFAQKAVQLDPMCQHAHFTMAYVHLHQRDKAKLFNEIDRIITLNPNSSIMVALAGWLMSLAGEWERGLSIMEEGLKLNPYHPSWFHVPKYLYYYKQGDYEKALTEILRVDMPQMPLLFLFRAAVLGQLGRIRDAQKEITEGLRMNPAIEGNVLLYIRGFVFINELEDHLCNGLRKAGLKT
jgi:TolB-like protein